MVMGDDAEERGRSLKGGQTHTDDSEGRRRWWRPVWRNLGMLGGLTLWWTPPHQPRGTVAITGAYLPITSWYYS